MRWMGLMKWYQFPSAWSEVTSVVNKWTTRSKWPTSSAPYHSLSSQCPPVGNPITSQGVVKPTLGITDLKYILLNWYEPKLNLCDRFWCRHPGTKFYWNLLSSSGNKRVSRWDHPVLHSFYTLFAGYVSWCKLCFYISYLLFIFFVLSMNKCQDLMQRDIVFRRQWWWSQLCYYAGDSPDHHTARSATKTQLNLALQWRRGKSDAGDISHLILCMVKLSLCLIVHRAMKTWAPCIHNTDLDGGEWSASCFGCFILS
jgi:hypothetical protein